MSTPMKQFTFDDSESRIMLTGAWQRVLKRIQGELPIPVMSRFINPLEPLALEGSVVRINCPGKFVMEWVRERHLGIIQSYLSDELGQSITIQLESTGREKPAAAPSEGVNIPVPTIVEVPTRFTPNPKFQFDTYVVGQSNRLAVAGAKNVAESPGQKFNPLFIYGPSGLGKTHLLHAIASEILKRDPDFPLVYMSAQQFAEDFINAIQSNRVDQFRRQTRPVGLWLLDDIQFIAGKDRTQEEFFHTFNHLHSMGKQIVITSDKPPRELFMMEERLRSRFESGLVADIQMPDTETRCAIIKKKAIAEQIDLDHEVAMYLAEHVPGNIRVLEGALTKLTVQASLDGRPLSLDLTEELIERHYGAATMAKPSIGQIIDRVSRELKISSEDIVGPSRKAPIVQARHVAVYVSREVLGDSWKHLASHFGDRDHTSIMHGYQKVSEHMLYDKDLRAMVKKLLRDLDDRIR